MSVNQKIKICIKQANITYKQLGDELEMDADAVGARINRKKEIDDVKFINGVCKLTDKPFSYFKRVYGMMPVTDHELDSMVMEDEAQYVKGKALKNAAEYWQNEYNMVKERLDRAHEYIKQLEANL